MSNNMTIFHQFDRIFFATLPSIVTQAANYYFSSSGFSLGFIYLSEIILLARTLRTYPYPTVACRPTGLLCESQSRASQHHSSLQLDSYNCGLLCDKADQMVQG